MAVGALAAFLAAFGVVGSDALWVVPLGAEVAHGHLPASIPYATAPTSGWHDVPALGQLVLWALYHAFGGVRGLVVAQAVAVAIAFGSLAYGLRRESALLVSAIVLAGALPAVVVTNTQLFSLALFALLLLVLQSRRPLWVSVPLILVWGNLHGEVLTGWALLACYVVFERRRAWPVLVAATVALGLTPALWHTPSYYLGVFQSEVAHTGEGLWAPLGLGPFDVLLMVAVSLLAVALRGGRVRLWEAVALVGLGAATVHVARNGVSLLFVAAYPAARALSLRSPSPRLLACAGAILATAAVVSLARGPVTLGSPQLARDAARTGRPVLADAYLGQQVVLAGGRVWVENPIDAFRRPDQRLYLDWLAGRPSGNAAVEHARYVLVQAASAAGKRAAGDARLAVVEKTPAAVLYRVKRR